MGDNSEEKDRYFLVEFSVWVTAKNIIEAEKEAIKGLQHDILVKQKRTVDLGLSKNHYVKEIQELPE